jgi:4-diphosphocytidyl-2-C-methyl-D-erythritol kinase
MAGGDRTITVAAPAKVNLFLRVVGKRPDGYHDLETWMQKVDLCDVVGIRLSSGNEVSCSCSDPALPGDDRNLAVKAAKAFQEVCPAAADCSIRLQLTKNIPMAAGLGGGSSDAGAVLRGLNSLFGEQFSSHELIELAKPLGADVPFFAINSGAVVAEGIGDVMYPVDSINDGFLVLVNPGFCVSTKWVYENLTLTRRAKNSKLARFQLPRTLALLPPRLVNDLECVTVAKYPEIMDIKHSLQRLGAVGTLMSGSGPTVFGVFPRVNDFTEESCHQIVLELQKRYGGKVYLTKTYTGV